MKRKFHGIYGYNGVSDEILILCRKLKRKELYQEECELRWGRIYFKDFEQTLERIPDPATITEEILDNENYEEEQRKGRLLKILPYALEYLKKANPFGYQIIIDHYLADNRLSVKQLARKYHTTIGKVKYNLKKSMELLRDYLTKQENAGK